MRNEIGTYKEKNRLKKRTKVRKYTHNGKEAKKYW